MTTQTQDALKLLEMARHILEKSENENLRTSAQFLRESILWAQRAQHSCSAKEDDEIMQRPILNSQKD
jgi:hypothetical protein